MTRVPLLAAVSLTAWGILAGPAIARSSAMAETNVTVTAGKPSEFRVAAERTMRSAVTLACRAPSTQTADTEVVERKDRGMRIQLPRLCHGTR